MAKALAAYGVSYKKGKDFKAQGRGQAPLQHTAKSETDDFLLNMLPEKTKVIDISEVEGGASFMTSCWSYSIAAGNTSFLAPPNGAAMMRVLGSTEVLLLKLQELMAFMTSTMKDNENEKKQDLMQRVIQWSEDDLKKVLGDGKVTMSRGCLGVNEALFIPSGWLLVERVPSGQSAIYGVRKSMFIDTVANKEGYTALREFYVGQQRDVSRMDKVLALFRCEVAEA